MLRAAALLVCFTLALPALTAQQRAMVAEDLWNIKRVGPPSVSPDGKWAAVEVTSHDIDKDEATSHAREERGAEVVARRQVDRLHQQAWLG
jgi:hypothetical protein